METRKKAKVHMLPTDIKGGQGHTLWTNKNGQLLHTKTSSNDLQGQHLYFTTDEKVILGDAKVFLYEGKTYVSSTSNRFDDFNMAKAKNIIASTDKSLPFNLPQIPQSFIEDYCKASGIDEVLVEFECLQSVGFLIVDFSKNTPETTHRSEPKCIEYRLKVDDHNTITVHPAKSIENALIWIENLPIQTLTDDLKQDIIERIENNL